MTRNDRALTPPRVVVIFPDKTPGSRERSDWNVRRRGVQGFTANDRISVSALSSTNEMIGIRYRIGGTTTVSSQPTTMFTLEPFSASVTAAHALSQSRILVGALGSS